MVRVCGIHLILRPDIQFFLCHSKHTKVFMLDVACGVIFNNKSTSCLSCGIVMACHHSIRGPYSVAINLEILVIIKMTSPILSALLTIQLILIFMVITCLAGRDFYKILGVSKGATEYEIKRSFRKLAIKMHPDKNIDDKDATKNFQDLREAFEVLSDPKKRKLYDEGGEEKLKKSGSQGSGMDPFESFFGEFFGFGTNENESKETPKGKDVLVDLWVTYEELYVGQFVELQRIKPVYQPFHVFM